jgi:CubicO group peptidase (beta-lactamase class C family)
MKKVTTAMLAVTLFFVVGAATLETSSKEKGRPSKLPQVSLHVAALQGNREAVRQHIEAGSDLNAKDAYGSTPLIIAATFGKTEVARALIEAGADMNIRNNEGATPLHIAALFCRPEIVKALLDKGANKYLRDSNGSTAFDIVAAPFGEDQWIYDQLGAALGALGLKLDYEQIRMTRPQIKEMLRPRTEDLAAVVYTPLPGNDWKVSTPAEQGLDPMLVAELYLDAAELETLYGLLVIKNGFLIAEGYFNGGAVDQLSKRASVTKSYTSALVGIALDRGCLSSLDQKMMEFFPEVGDQIKDHRKKAITIREMLQMRTGYPWEETDPVYWDALWSGDYLHHIVDIPLTSDPGTEFQYSNLTSHWLGIVVARTCDTDLKSFGQKNLFSPLDVKVGDWNRDLDGYYIGCGDIQFTARDMAKFGLLYLNEGSYKGKQVISANWVRESLQKYSENINSAGIKSSRVGRYFRDIGYGYQWWSARVGDHHFNFAWGHGGQLIVLLDGLDMVIVVTADPFYGKDEHWQSWKYEKANLNLVGKFIKSLPKE